MIREDSGEALGRTPLTITLPQGSEVISFRFEKAGHASISYKVIPDLDKSVRAELMAAESTSRSARLRRRTRAGRVARARAGVEGERCGRARRPPWSRAPRSNRGTA